MGDGIGLAEKMLGLARLGGPRGGRTSRRGGGPCRVDEGEGHLSVVSTPSPGAGPRRGPPARPALLRTARTSRDQQASLAVPDQGLHQKTWTEKLSGIVPRQVLTVRAGMEVTRQVGQLCRSVASVAAEYGVGWDTAWAAVECHGRPLVDDAHRGSVRSGPSAWTSTRYLSAKPEHATIYATSLVDLDRRIVIDLFEGKSAIKLRRWSARRPESWRRGVKVVALDLTETYRAGLRPHFAHVRRVADPFHVTRVANRMVDQVRRRVQNETLGHRGRKAGSPLSDPQAAVDGTKSVSTNAGGTSSSLGCVR